MTGFEPVAACLGSRCATTALHPHDIKEATTLLRSCLILYSKALFFASTNLAKKCIQGGRRISPQVMAKLLHLLRGQPLGLGEDGRGVAAEGPISENVYLSEFLREGPS